MNKEWDEIKPSELPSGSRTVGVTSGQRLRDMFKEHPINNQTADQTNNHTSNQTSNHTTNKTASQSNNPESDSTVKRNANSNGNVQALSSSSSFTSNNMAHSNSTNPIFNYNLKAVAINSKILPSTQPSNYYIDKETYADLKQKLTLLTSEGESLRAFWGLLFFSLIFIYNMDDDSLKLVSYFNRLDKNNS